MMRVLAWPSDRGGCGHYRLWWPCAALEAQGHDVEATETATVLAMYDRDWTPADADPPLEVSMVGLVEPPDADVVVLQRPTHWSRVRLIELLQTAGIAVVVEIDDDYSALPKGHPGRAHWSPARNPDRNKRWLLEACRRADLVTVTTQALAERYAPHGRAAVLPNCVPAWYLDVEEDHDHPPIIGWPGSPVTHVGDLDVLGSAIVLVQDRHEVRFRAIGDERTLQELGAAGDFVEWAELTDTGPGGYPRQVAALDVGIVPLADNRFNQAKSALKLCEMSALGVAAVASPSPDNVRMHELGCGVLASTWMEWCSHLSLLVRDNGWRAEIAGRGREAMRAWTYEGNAWRWWEAWERALENRRGSVAA